MTKTKLFAAAAVLTSMIATPVLAQGMKEPVQKSTKIKKQQIKKPAMRQSQRRLDRDRSADMRYDRGGDIRYDRGVDRRYGTNTGFFPLDAATGIAAGAVGTAGAIATAPFRDWNDGYAYNDGRWDNRYDRAGNDNRYVRTGYRDSYASSNGFGPGGAFFTGPNERTYQYDRATPATGFFGQTYAERNGFVCVPGTEFTNANGIPTLCQ